MSVERVHVAVGVVLNSDNQILLALRPEKAHQGGRWEFPGGKVEPDENVQQALYRELQEELGITPLKSRPLIEIHHDYSDKSVFLDVWWVDAFDGEPKGCEGQPLRWSTAKELDDHEFPEANQAIIKSVQQALLG